MSSEFTLAALAFVPGCSFVASYAPMTGIGEIAGLATVLSTARRLLRELRDKNLTDQHARLVQDASDVVADATDRLVAIQASLIDLQQTNQALQARLDEAGAWTKKLESYELFGRRLVPVPGF